MISEKLSQLNCDMIWIWLPDKKHKKLQRTTRTNIAKHNIISFLSSLSASDRKIICVRNRNNKNVFSIVSGQRENFPNIENKNGRHEPHKRNNNPNIYLSTNEHLFVCVWNNFPTEIGEHQKSFSTIFFFFFSSFFSHHWMNHNNRERDRVHVSIQWVASGYRSWKYFLKTSYAMRQH